MYGEVYRGKRNKIQGCRIFNRGKPVYFCIVDGRRGKQTIALLVLSPVIVLTEFLIFAFIIMWLLIEQPNAGPLPYYTNINTYPKP